MTRFAILAMVSACVSSTSPPLRTVAPGAPVTQRVQTYRELELIGLHTGRPGTVPYAHLGGGGMVHERELGAVVIPSSPTARAVRHVTARERTAWRWFMAGAIAASLVAVPGLIAGVASDRESLGLGSIVTGAVLLFGGAILSMRADAGDADRAAVYQHYNDDLRAALALCIRGLDLVACPQ